MTPLETLFMRQANLFMFNNDEERFTKMYVCLAAFLEAQSTGEKWTDDKSVLECIEKAIQKHPKKYLFLKLLNEYNKSSLFQ